MTRAVDLLRRVDEAIAAHKDMRDPPGVEIVSMPVNVTALDDVDAELVRMRYQASGLGFTLVDDRVPARPGTVPGSSLTAAEREALAMAKAARLRSERVN
ncbi:hypothetical protein [Sphaerisporangium album]|nr:hypothetical protein [Sphaerisporangium album]